MVRSFVWNNFDSFILPAMASPLIALIACAIVYVSYPDSMGKQRSPLKFAAGAVSFAALGTILGLVLGTFWLCSPPGAGNLCGLAAVFTTAPLGLLLGITTFLYLWGKCYGGVIYTNATF